MIPTSWSIKSSRKRAKRKTEEEPLFNQQLAHMEKGMQGFAALMMLPLTVGCWLATQYQSKDSVSHWQIKHRTEPVWREVTFREKTDLTWEEI